MLTFFLRHPGQVSVTNADLRPRLGRELRQPVQHAGSPRDGTAPQAGGPWPSGHPHRARPGIPIRRLLAVGGAMSLTGRFSALFLSALASGARRLLDGPLRLGADLPRPPGQRPPGRGPGHSGGGGRDPSRRSGVGAARAGPATWARSRAPSGCAGWSSMIEADRIDHSRNLVDCRSHGGVGSRRQDGRVVRPGWSIGRAGPGERPSVASGPTRVPASGSKAAAHRKEAAASDASDVLHPFPCVLTACAPLDPMEATLATLGWFLVALSAGIWLLAALLCRRLSRRALTPLDADGRVGARP